jgi:hypothetical protein
VDGHDERKPKSDGDGGKRLDQERINPSMRSAVAPEVVISQSQGGAMHLTAIMPLVLVSFVVGAPMASAEVLNTHRIPAALAVEAARESIGVCAKPFIVGDVKGTIWPYREA